MDIYKSCRSYPEDNATKVQKQSNPPILGLKLLDKVDKSFTMDALDSQIIDLPVKTVFNPKKKIGLQHVHQTVC